MTVLDEYKINLEKTFRSCELCERMDEAERRRIVGTLVCPLHAVELFQYRKCTKESVEGLAKGTLLFKSPIRFNDPFDSMLFWDEARIKHYFEDDKYKRVLLNLNLLDAECVARSLSNCFRISCFSETCVSPIMWAHYADACKGYCVGYELHPSLEEPIKVGEGDSCEECHCSLFPVIYSKRRVDATTALSREIEYLVANENGTVGELPLDSYDRLEPYKTVLYKSSDWAYEHEWRVIIYGLTTTRDKDWLYPSENITHVILGPNMSPMDIVAVNKALREYVRFVNRPIKLQKIKVNLQSDAYAFEIEDWDKIPVPRY